MVKRKADRNLNFSLRLVGRCSKLLSQTDYKTSDGFFLRQKTDSILD